MLCCKHFSYMDSVAYHLFYGKLVLKRKIFALCFFHHLLSRSFFHVYLIEHRLYMQDKAYIRVEHCTFTTWMVFPVNFYYMPAQSSRTKPTERQPLPLLLFCIFNEKEKRRKQLQKIYLDKICINY